MITTRYDYRGKSALDRAADFCLEPTRYLFEGRRYYVMYGQPTKLREGPCFGLQYEIKTAPWKVAAKIASFIPGLIAGIALKLLAFCSSGSFRNVHRAMVDFCKKPEFQETPFTAPALKPSYSDKTLDEMNQLLFETLRPVHERITKLDIWNDDEFILRYTQCMELAYQQALVFYKQLNAECSGDKEKMAEVMIQQRRTPCYAYPFFRQSVAKLYQLARGKVFVVKDSYNFPTLTREYQLQFYDPKKVQNYWRQLYNSFCELLDTHELRGRIKDPRFSNWSKPDRISSESIVVSRGFPDTEPT